MITGAKKSVNIISVLKCCFLIYCSSLGVYGSRKTKLINYRLHTLGGCHFASCNDNDNNNDGKGIAKCI